MGKIIIIVFINKSKIQFEIYSQLLMGAYITIYKCLSINQRYNLKSIHNDVDDSGKDISSVYQ